ncbi:MAG TPA: helix-turn-helix transcriptional regulator [Bacteroidia bacterium]|jgi:putative transcriptional regulator|nr:helix-turn-helix transcriptional regulator [Bacteroidia bacterium]
MKKEEFNIALGKRVTKVRSGKGITMYRLAKITKKSQSLIQRLEQGKLNPSYYFLLEIAVGLEVSVAELTKGLK